MPYMRPAIDDTLTIVPSPRSRIDGSTARAHRSGPRRFVEMIACHASSVHSSMRGAGAAEAGVVDEHVDAALALEHLADAGAHAGVVVDVELQHLGVEALVAQHLGEVALVGVAHRWRTRGRPAGRRRARPW